VKRERINQIERQLLIALITSRDFLSQAVPTLDVNLLPAGPFREVCGWCITYFKEYGKAPNRDIETVYHRWAESNEGPEVEPIHDLLEGLSDEYDTKDPLNIPYLLDCLRSFLSKKNLQRLYESVETALGSGKPEEAERHVLEYKPVEMAGGFGLDPFRDGGSWERAFSDPAQPLMEFPEPAGRFLNPALTRDALVGIQAPEKRGKTWWCIEFVVRALRMRRKVAFFQVGDLSENQLLIRLGTYFTGRPSRQDLCGIVPFPLRLTEGTEPARDTDEEGENGARGQETVLPTVEVEDRNIKTPVTLPACRKALRRFSRGCGLNPKKSYLKISTHANSSINVLGICSILDRWEMVEGFIPDVVVIDYADILSPEDPTKQARDQVNDTWKALRRLSQDRHCLVLVPTQANAGSYETETQTMRNFSEDKRKLAHVTGMLGLNQSTREKEVGLMRLNWIVLRESPSSVGRCLWVGQCLNLGRAFCCARI